MIKLNSDCNSEDKVKQVKFELVEVYFFYFLLKKSMIFTPLSFKLILVSRFSNH
jgi:hypothetical protein